MSYINSMKTLNRKEITKILDKLLFGINYSISDITDGEFNSADFTLFLITKDNNLIYLIKFTISDSIDPSCYTVSGDMFFLTPNGCLSSDWVKLDESYIIKSDIKEAFILKCDEDEFDYLDLDNEIRKLWSTNETEVKPETFEEIDGRPLSNFLKSKIEFL